MKNVKKIYKSVLIILVIISCTDSRDLGFLEEVVLPSNISALFDITENGYVIFKKYGKCTQWEVLKHDLNISRHTKGKWYINTYDV